MPVQLHAVVLAMFASIIAPFGGFFASGFKRGFKIKDFGDSIPGHGGMTDRMDCQVSPSSDAMSPEQMPATALTGIPILTPRPCPRSL